MILSDRSLRCVRFGQGHQHQVCLTDCMHAIAGGTHKNERTVFRHYDSAEQAGMTVQ